MAAAASPDIRQGSYRLQIHSKKEALWKEAALKLEEPVDNLKCWFKSMRTRYGNLVKPKSGQAAKEHTDREKWILEKFAFVGSFIKRMTHTSTRIRTATSAPHSYPHLKKHQFQLRGGSPRNHKHLCLHVHKHLVHYQTFQQG